MLPVVNVDQMMREFEQLKITMAQSRVDLQAIIEERLQTVENEVREDLVEQLNTELFETLTNPETVDLLREHLHLGPYDGEEGAEEGQEPRKRRQTAMPISVELQVCLTLMKRNKNRLPISVFEATRPSPLSLSFKKTTPYTFPLARVDESF